MTDDDSMERQAWRLYLALLGRPPDETGLRGCISALKRGRTINNLFGNILVSDEFRRYMRNLLDDTRILDSDPWLNSTSDYATRQRLKVTHSREVLQGIQKHQGRLAVVAPYPPAQTGVATATLQTFEMWEGGVDFYGDFVSLQQLIVAQKELKLRNSSHNVLSHAVLPEALASIGYEAVVFAFGNSSHNVHVVHWLLKAKEITPSSIPVLAYVHDPVIFNLLRMAEVTEGYRFSKLFLQAYGIEKVEQYLYHSYHQLLEAGFCGMRAIARVTRIDHVISIRQRHETFCCKTIPILIRKSFTRCFTRYSPSPGVSLKSTSGSGRARSTSDLSEWRRKANDTNCWSSRSACSLPKEYRPV